MQLLRISTDTANTAKLATARMVKEVPGLTMSTESRTRSDLQYRKVGEQMSASFVCIQASMTGRIDLHPPFLSSDLEEPGNDFRSNELSVQRDSA